MIRLIACLAPLAALAQGFAGLGQDVEGYRLPERPAAFDFPADHGPHPGYRIEWWYVTMNLEAADGTPMGAQWTLFRSALAPEGGDGWAAPEIWMAHAAVTTPERHLAAERFGRSAAGQAGVTAVPFRAWLDDWALEGTFDDLAMTAGGDDFAIDLRLTAEGPLIFHGEGGYSVKSEAGHASYYYSQPHYAVAGTLTVAGEAIAVTGGGWLDREWSSQPLDADQEGWDWLSLHLEDGTKVMAFALRGANRFLSGSWIDGGAAEPLGDFTLTPIRTAAVAERDVPVGWRLEVPGRGLDLTVEAVNPGAWMPLTVSYWEGPVRVSGSHGGIGYLEMTGY